MVIGTWDKFLRM